MTKNTISIEYPNASFTAMDRSSRQKVNKEILALNYSLYQKDLVDIYRMFQPQMKEDIFFSSAHITFSKINHCWGTKLVSTNLGLLKSYRAYFLNTVV